MYYVYELINPITNTPFYVGYTNSPERRLSEHCDPRCNQDALVSRYINTLSSHGGTPLMNIIATSPTKKQALVVEESKIDEYFYKYTILNERFGKTNPYKFDRKAATKEELVDNCGLDGLHCGYIHECAKCRAFALRKRAEIIQERIGKYPVLYTYVLIDSKEWRPLYKKINRCGFDYIGVPQKDGSLLLVCSDYLAYKQHMFCEIATKDAIDLLSTEGNLAPTNESGQMVSRRASFGWRLTD